MFQAHIVKDQLILWISNYFKNNAPADARAVVGISGGKDSSIVAALCAAALGKTRVLGVLMPAGEQADIEVSYALCRTLNIPHLLINIQEATTALFKELGSANLNLNSMARLNTPARLRMTTLYAVSGIVGGRVANTCNLSEDYVGYSTKFGDSAGDFSPLSDLTVTEVKAVGRALGLDAAFVDKTPIDGLCGKTDEENLGFSYAVLDRYIREGVCEDLTIREKIDARHTANQHKLMPMPSFRLLPYKRIT